MQIARLLAPRLCHLSLLASIAGGFAAVPNPTLSDNPNWAVTVWQSSDGLPNNYLTGIVQSADGYLWIGTYTSLVRFDGMTFDAHAGESLTKPTIDEIAALMPARDGGLWVGGVHGAVVHIGGTHLRLPMAGLPDQQVMALTEIPPAGIWIALRDGTVCRIEGHRVIPLRDADPDGRAPSRLHHGGEFATDTLGRLWFAKDGHVGLIQGDTYSTVFWLRPSATRIAAARRGGLWVTNGGKLFRTEDGRLLRECGTLPIAHNASAPTQLVESDDGVWIGTTHDGLIRFDGTRFETVPTSDANITALFADRVGNVWVGTRNGGLNRLRRRVVELQRPTAKSICSVCQDVDGLVWAATDDGQLLCRNGDRWSTAAALGLSSVGRVSCVAASPDGALWIGTREGALHRWQHGTLKTWTHSEGLSGRAIHALLVGQSGDVWIGEEAPDAVQRLHDGRPETVATPDGLRFVRAIAQDTAGNVWIGTSRGILLRMTEHGAVDETSRLNPTLRSIRCLCASADGGIWLGYAEKGIGWVKDHELHRLPAPQAAPDTNISQIVADDHGSLWLAGDGGIFKVRAADLEAYAAGRLEQVHIVHYGASEALTSIEANWGDSPGAARAADGTLWIAMRTGLAVIHPDRIRDDSAPPPVFIDRLAVDDRIVASDRGGAAESHSPLRLEPGHHRLEFSFTALSFDAPENVRFRYRLNGLDDAWIDSGTERRAVYSRLAAGAYTFRVQACNSSGVWNRAGVALAFEVAPFFWQTWWFKALTIGWSVVLAATLVRYFLLRRIHENLRRLREQRALDQERARIARDLHDDFGTRLTELGLLAELGEAGKPAGDRNHRELVEHIRSMERDLDTIVWAVNPNNDSLDHLVGFICRTTSELFEKTGTRLRLHVPDAVPARPLSPELRHNLFMVVREAAANVVKHAQATAATLTLNVDDDTFYFRIEDNGTGFVVPDAMAGDRNGLKNMAARISENRGRISVQSSIGGGTIIEAWLPLTTDSDLTVPHPASQAPAVCP